MATVEEVSREPRLSRHAVVTLFAGLREGRDTILHSLAEYLRHAESSSLDEMEERILQLVDQLEE